MTDLVPHIPDQLNSALVSLSGNNQQKYQDILREAIVDYILKSKFPSQMAYDDSDEDLVKNAQLSSELSLLIKDK